MKNIPDNDFSFKEENSESEIEKEDILDNKEKTAG